VAVVCVFGRMLWVLCGCVVLGVYGLVVRWWVVLFGWLRFVVVVVCWVVGIVPMLRLGRDSGRGPSWEWGLFLREGRSACGGVWSPRSWYRACGRGRWSGVVWVSGLCGWYVVFGRAVWSVGGKWGVVVLWVVGGVVRCRGAVVVAILV
jgi:hypothetical protein